MEHRIKVKSSAGFKLPLSLVGRPDILRIIRELESLENEISQQSVRKVAAKINYSPSLATLVVENHIEMTDIEQRRALRQKLIDIKDKSPQVQISFAVEPPTAVVGKVLLWLRREIDTSILLSVGIQPGIAAGCVLKTTSKYFDFSLRRHLLDHSDVLVERLRSLQ